MWWVAAAVATAVAAASPPVNVILSTSGWPQSAAPASAPPGTTLTTPGGSPACSQSLANTSPENGVCSGGFSTTQLPAASAGASLSASAMTGPFHGMIATTTPYGSGST